MVSSVHVDGSLPDAGDAAPQGLVFAGAWGVHFVVSNPVLVDVPEWSGETFNGTPWGVSDRIPGVAVSGIAYRALTTAQAIDNPSSYAAFAQETFFTPTMPGAAGTRVGAARPHE